MMGTMEERVGKCGPDSSPLMDGRPNNSEDPGPSPAVSSRPPASPSARLAAPRSRIVRIVRIRRPQASVRVRPLAPRPSRQLILFLASNPSGTMPLALGEECAAIERAIALAPARDDFDFRSKWAVSVDEMMRCLNLWHPAIIHFSGHGSVAPGLHLPEPAAALHAPATVLRDIGPAADHGPGTPGTPGTTGIHLQDAHVTGDALGRMIASAAPEARVLVLNACFSAAVAEALCNEVDCVVSMRGAIGDEAACVFATGFYRALASGRSVGNAVAQAVALLTARQLPLGHPPVCRTREGLSAEEIFLCRDGEPWP